MNKNDDMEVVAWFRPGMMIALILLVGCRTPVPSASEPDTRLVRYTETGAEHFAEGQSEQAVEFFRKALYRAWSKDDPYYSGTNAYNLAAALFDLDEPASALDWLVDARAEFARAAASAGNTYLLEAKIAQSQGRMEAAFEAIALAQRSPAPCAFRGEANKCASEACQDPWLSCLPCFGTKIENADALQQCRDDYRGQVHLARARLAAEQGDVGLATQQLAAACAHANEVCSHELQAEIHHVAAMIEKANGQLMQSAAHLEAEARVLRWAGNYRRIPEVLIESAENFQEIGRVDLAADRLCRAARVYLSRGELKIAWDVLQETLTAGEADLPPQTRIRLRLTALEIEAAAAAEENDPMSEALPEEEPINATPHDELIENSIDDTITDPPGPALVAPQLIGPG